MLHFNLFISFQVEKLPNQLFYMCLYLQTFQMREFSMGCLWQSCEECEGGKATRPFSFKARSEALSLSEAEFKKIY